MTIQTADIKNIQSTFEASENATSPVRKKAFENFTKQGYPHPKSESWRYANFNKILKEGYAPAGNYEAGELKEASFKSFLISEGNPIRLVFVDGFFNTKLSTIYDIKGFSFKNLKSESLQNETPLVKEESLIQLNAAFAKDGAIIKIEDKAIIEETIEIYNITTCPGLKIIQPKHQIEVGEAAQVTFVESFHNLCMDSSFTNTVVSINVAKNAVVNYIKIEHPKKPNTYVTDHTLVNQDANSTFNIYTITLSGALIRNNIHIISKGEFTTTNMYGLYLLRHGEIVDNKTIMDHAVPNCYSNELYKGILDNTSTGTFNGKIIVREDAQKTNAYQNNRNILMSDEATVNTRPQLEIFADDVKCSHGATSAQIEEKELFYLRARGIGKEKARALLMKAFASEVWKTIPKADIKEYIEKTVDQALGIDI